MSEQQQRTSQQIETDQTEQELNEEHTTSIQKLQVSSPFAFP